jgi:hypothetical protein
MSFCQESGHFGDGDCFVLTDLDAAFAADTFVRVDRNGFFILNFAHIYRTDINAFSTTNTSSNVRFRFLSHNISPLIVFL